MMLVGRAGARLAMHRRCSASWLGSLEGTGLSRWDGAGRWDPQDCRGLGWLQVGHLALGALSVLT